MKIMSAIIFVDYSFCFSGLCYDNKHALIYLL